MPVVAKAVDFGAAGLVPARRAFAITKSDTDELAYVTRYVYVGGAGDLTVILAGDSAEVLLKALPIGLYALAVKKVMSTGTVAANLVGLY